MERDGIAGSSLRWTTATASVVALVVAVTLCCATVAGAQQAPPADEQYGNPARSVGPEVGTQAEDSSGASGGDSSTITNGPETSGSSAPAIGVLPDTGGPLLALVVLGVGALVGFGMLLMRKVGR